jgi:CRISPR-associated exonuclease Cas4
MQANAKDTFMLEVTDLKQWTHCPRIVFYRYCLPSIRPITGKMEEGILRHSEERDREERRQLRSYDLTEGERFFDVPLRSPTLGLSGRLDLLIITPARDAPNAEGIIVEYKLSDRKPGPHVKLQLAAYGLLVENLWNIPVRRGFLYQLPLRRAEPIAFTTQLKNRVRTTITSIRTTIASERLPPPPDRQAICVSCEFRRFCNDVL